MKYGGTIGWFIGGAVIVAAFGAVPAMAGEGGGENPFHPRFPRRLLPTTENASAMEHR